MPLNFSPEWNWPHSSPSFCGCICKPRVLPEDVTDAFEVQTMHIMDMKCILRVST